MSQKVIFIKLLLVHYATLSLAETRADCNEDILLRCPDVDTHSMNFLSVTWYKVNSDKKYGIVRRGKGEDATQSYNFPRPARFGENYGLFLPNVTPEDSGSYECAMSARVGGQNLKLRVDLIVNVCVTQADLTPVTCPDLLCHNQAEDLPGLWGIMSFMAVGLTKIILSLISIWIIRAVRAWSSRRQRQKRRSEL